MQLSLLPAVLKCVPHAREVEEEDEEDAAQRQTQDPLTLATPNTFYCVTS